MTTRRTRRLKVTACCLALAALWSSAFSGGNFGPDTCMEGYVWREACGPKDHVCVTPRERDQARSDNASAGARINPSNGQCRPGYVWREACGPQDHACVTPQRRAQEADNNRRAGERGGKTGFCRAYAKDAVDLENIRHTCGCKDDLSGPRWSNNPNGHFDWCMNSARKEDADGERFARYKELSNCSYNALCRGAVAGYRNQRPPSRDPSQPGCCWVPAPGQPGKVQHVCGPECPR